MLAGGGAAFGSSAASPGVVSASSDGVMCVWDLGNLLKPDSRKSLTFPRTADSASSSTRKGATSQRNIDSTSQGEKLSKSQFHFLFIY